MADKRYKIQVCDRGGVPWDAKEQFDDLTAALQCSEMLITAFPSNCFSVYDTLDVEYGQLGWEDV